MAEKKSVSMQDIADELGVSKVTVSKALNGKEGVGEALKKKIADLAEKSGYVLPNYGNRKTKKVGIIMSDRFNSGDEGKFYMAMYEKIISELQKASCTSMMISPNRHSLAGDLQTIKSSGIFDGLIFLGILDWEVKKQLDAVNLPKIYVDVYDETHKSDSVVTENIYSCYEITNYLIHQGHTEIGFVGTVGATTSITDRYLGYVRSMLENNITPQDVWNIPDRSQEGEAIPLELPKEMPTAFVCNCDETAFQLVKELTAKGYHIPEDISVAGFDNSIYAQICSPPLTTVAVDIEEIGKLAARRMIKHMSNPAKKGGGVFRVPGNIIYRESVRNIKREEQKS